MRSKVGMARRCLMMVLIVLGVTATAAPAFAGIPVGQPKHGCILAPEDNIWNDSPPYGLVGGTHIDGTILADGAKDNTCGNKPQ